MFLIVSTTTSGEVKVKEPKKKKKKDSKNPKQQGRADRYKRNVLAEGTGSRSTRALAGKSGSDLVARACSVLLSNTGSLFRLGFYIINLRMVSSCPYDCKLSCLIHSENLRANNLFRAYLGQCSYRCIFVLPQQHKHLEAEVQVIYIQWHHMKEAAVPTGEAMCNVSIVY